SIGTVLRLKRWTLAPLNKAENSIVFGVNTHAWIGQDVDEALQIEKPRRHFSEADRQGTLGGLALVQFRGVASQPLIRLIENHLPCRAAGITKSRSQKAIEAFRRQFNGLELGGFKNVRHVLPQKANPSKSNSRIFPVTVR